VAIIFVDAQLASGSRLRAAQDAARAADERRIEIAIERSKERTKLIEKEIEQLRQENARLKALNASVRRLCFPPESSSIPQSLIEPDSKPSLPS
jgi:16S rRNA C967 or C1407 C5-methylase (RsmB/RsmF family)